MLYGAYNTRAFGTRVVMLHTALVEMQYYYIVSRRERAQVFPPANTRRKFFILQLQGKRKAEAKRNSQTNVKLTV